MSKWSPNSDEHCGICKYRRNWPTADLLVCTNPDSDHYQHVLSVHHPACNKFIKYDQQENDGCIYEPL